MRFICIGDLVLDVYYDENLNYIGCDGGISAFNIICNLKSMGFNTKAYGVCGNDEYGELAIKSLQDCNVEKDIKKLSNIKTKSYQIIRVIENNKLCFRSIKKCPMCGENCFYEESYIDEKDIKNEIKKEDIIVLDNMNNKNQYIIDNTNNIKLLDLGQYKEFSELNPDEIICKIKNKFKIINLNQRVEKYLLDKLNIKNDIDIAKVLKVELLIITRGIGGCSLIFNNKEYDYKLRTISEEVDDSGAGDIFFSTIIKNWVNNNYRFDSNKFPVWIDEANSNASKIVQLIGSRSLIKELYKYKPKMNCKCNN